MSLRYLASFSNDDIEVQLREEMLSRRRQRRATSCPAVDRVGSNEGECWFTSPAPPSMMDREHSQESNDTSDEAASSSNNTEPMAYLNMSTAHMNLTLPSLVDDKESNCSSTTGTPLHRPADNPGYHRACSTLNAAAAAFVPTHPAAAAVPQQVPVQPQPQAAPQMAPQQQKPPVLLTCYPPVLQQQQLLQAQAAQQPQAQQAVPHMAQHVPQQFTMSLATDEVPCYAAVAGNAINMSSTPEGSRILQKCLPVWPKLDVELFFEELRPHVKTLMRDVTGNYVLQRLLEYSTPKVRSGFAACLYGNMLELSMQPYACRMVQRVLEVIEEGDCLALASELDGHIPACVQDQHGNHVVQKLVDIMPHNSSFIVRSFVGRVLEVSTHSYGCRVVQRVLERCRDSPDIVKVLEEILHYVEELSLDQYGNYVVQHVVRHGHPQYQFAIASKLAGKYTMMCTHKFASNVVEKLLQFVDSSRGSIAEELFLPSPLDRSVSSLVSIAMDPYGNYVAQKVCGYLPLCFVFYVS